MRYEYKEKPKFDEMTQKLIPKYDLVDDTFIADWQIVDKDIEEVADLENQTFENPIFEEIRTLKLQLAESDYKAIKYAEGYYTEEEYAPIKKKRQRLRDKINALEEEYE